MSNVKKWEKLLDNFDTNQKIQVAELLELSLPYSSRLDKPFSEYMVPIIIRVYTGVVTYKYTDDKIRPLIYNIISLDEIYNLIKSTCLELNDDFNLYKILKSKLLNIDVDLELIILISRDYLEVLFKYFDNYTYDEMLKKLILLSRDKRINSIIK